MIDINSISECPHCGYDEYYHVTRMSGVGQYNYRWDDKDSDNTELHDCLNYAKNKTAYCVQCHKKIGIRK